MAHRGISCKDLIGKANRWYGTERWRGEKTGRSAGACGVRRAVVRRALFCNLRCLQGFPRGIHRRRQQQLDSGGLRNLSFDSSASGEHIVRSIDRSCM